MEKDLFGICPYTTAQKILAGKWSLLILYHLSTKVMRFNELQRILPRMTNSTLSKQLHTMEKNGLIIRTMYNEMPPKVEYSLSDLGKNFQLVLNALKTWGEDYINYLEKNVTENVNLQRKE